MIQLPGYIFDGNTITTVGNLGYFMWCLAHIIAIIALIMLINYMTKQIKKTMEDQK